MGSTKNCSKYREQLLASPVGDWKLREKGQLPENTLGVLSGHFAVFNRWTHIDSFWEGEFMERIAPGAFSKTFQENGTNVRCLFNHGKDPSIGMKILGDIRSMDQDDHGAAYDVNLYDTSFNRDLAPGLRSGMYGASFRFQVIKEEINDKPDPSDANPRGMPERTIQELRLMEFGPVTFPAYADATAGLRALDYFEFTDFATAARAYPDKVAQFLAFHADDDMLELVSQLRSKVRSRVASATRDDGGNVETTPDPEPEKAPDPEPVEEPRSVEAASSPEAPTSEPEQSIREQVDLFTGADPLDLELATLTPSSARSLITAESEEEEPWKL